jgi:hypothetical protein
VFLLKNVVGKQCNNIDWYTAIPIHLGTIISDILFSKTPVCLKNFKTTDSEALPEPVKTNLLSELYGLIIEFS